MVTRMVAPIVGIHALDGGDGGGERVGLAEGLGRG
jgi:hypothetical protein